MISGRPSGNVEFAGLGGGAAGYALTEGSGKMTGIFDTHAHYDDEAFDDGRRELLDNLPKEGILRVVNVGAGPKSCERALELAEEYDYIYCAVGVHPAETAQLDEALFARIRDMCLGKKCVAVGEIGLDYHWDEPGRDIQKKWFVRQLQLARELGLPVVIHSRDAARDTVDIMGAERAGEIGGVVHCYSYTKETAGIFLDMGFYFGIGGVLTFQNAKKLREAVEYIPLDRIVLETDCPYLAPVPHRGERNSSLYLPYVVSALARIKGMGEEEIRQAVWENSLRLYRMEGYQTVDGRKARR